MSKQTSKTKQLINRDTLITFLHTTRPAQSASEQAFADDIMQLIRELGHTPTQDKHGNIVLNLLPPDDTLPMKTAHKTRTPYHDTQGMTKSRVMFTSHTDSVHHTDTGGQKLVWLDADKTTIALYDTSKKATSNCLGADDATGVYIMLRLIQAGVPALYVFFRDEEVGGLGSEYYRNDPANADLLPTLTHCISFDRKDYHSIITHQWAGRCASDEFAKDFGSLLNEINPSLTLKADNTGSFTDSANFTDIISECTNISVGYFSQHTVYESQDIAFADALADALAEINWLALPSYRDPSETGYTSRYDKRQSTQFGTQGGIYDGYYYGTLSDDAEAVFDEIRTFGYEHALQLVRENPEIMAEILTEIAYTS